MLKVSRFWMIAIAFVGISKHAVAGEVSLMKGFYQSAKVRDGLESTNISLGGRYLEGMGGNLAWYVNFSLGIKSYSAPSNEPGNQTDINGGGGVRMKMPPLTEKIIPYISAGAFYKSETSAPMWTPVATTWQQDSGLFYDGALGMHFLLATDFFMDLETSLFTSALAGKSTQIAKTPASETKSETDSTDLFVNTSAAFKDTKVALGLKF